MSQPHEEQLIIKSKEFKSDIDSLRKARQLEDYEVLDAVRDTLAKKWGLKYLLCFRRHSIRFLKEVL